MLRTLVLAGLVTMLGATTSAAQYRDSAPPDDEYVSEYETESTYDDGYYDGYDEELLGSREWNREHRRYSEPDVDVGIFGSLGYDGSWHMSAGFGWVWRPYAATSWRPYSQGRWVWTSYGWTWVSYESFGWATYHYGSWMRDPMLGWVWIPGYEWAACRVQFAYYDNYISWAPIAPVGYHCPQPWSTAGISFWFTVGASNFCDPYPVRYCVTPKYKSWYSERVAYKSPDRHYVERYVGSPVRESKVHFKNTTWRKVEGGNAHFNSKSFNSKSSKSMVTRSKATREFTAAKRSSGSGSYAMKSKPRLEQRKFSAEPQRNLSPRKQAVKPQRETRENRVLKAERSSKQRSQPQQSRVTRAERSSKQTMKSYAAREQRSVQKAQRAERTSKPSMQRAERSSKQSVQRAERRSSGSSERKATYSSDKSSGKRDVARAKSSGGKGRGKAK